MTPLSIRREPDSAAPSVRRRYASGTTGRLLPLDAPRSCPTHGPMTLDQQWFGGYYGYVRFCAACRISEFDVPGGHAA